MRYIVLDLEWNSAYFKKQGRFINEIIQIGAVKLNDNFDIIDTFDVNVKSAICKKLSRRVIELTGITNEVMLSGISFEEAVDRYNYWAGEDNITMTWSNSDLHVIADNRGAFLPEGKNINIRNYLDLQTFVQNELKLKGNAITSQISLSNAAKMFGIDTDSFVLHTAQDDSALASKMLKLSYNEERFLNLVRDTSNPEFYKRLLFKPYYISNLKDKRVKGAYLNFTCPHCKQPLVRDTKWKYKNNWFRSEFLCDKCDIKLRCMISFKQTYDKVVTYKRVLPLVRTEEKPNETRVQLLSEKM